MPGELPFKSPPQTKSGRVILLATIKAKAGQGDKVQELLTAVRAAAESSSEPGTHTYRTVRGAEGNDDVFTVFEEYDVDEGIHAHVAGETFQALAGAGVIADLDIKYFEEFK